MSGERCAPTIKVKEVTRVELLLRKAWLEEQMELRAALSDWQIADELSEINYLLGD